jgi:hypothetical protein
MSGAVRFQVELYQPNADRLPELAGRIQDLSPAFKNIILEWAKDNEDKFGLSVGKEASGASIDPTVFWEALSPQYMKSKRKQGMTDQIMSATGSLKQSLTTPDQFLQSVTEQQALFGSPLSADDAMKAQYNWIRRQTIFLSLDDQRMIQKEISDYLSLGQNYRQIQFAKGLERLALKKEVAQLDIAFDNATEEDAFGGDWPTIE